MSSPARRATTTAAKRLVTHAAAAPIDDEIARELADTDDTLLRTRCDDIARRVVRAGGHITMTALARECGTTPPTLRRLMATTTYRRIYDTVSDELLGTIDDRIADERLDLMTRGDSLKRRAMTVLGECFELVRQHKLAVANGANVRPGLLKVGIDAAAEVRQLTALANGAPGNTTNVNINLTRTQATLIQGAIRESGIDMSDVLGGMFGAPTIDLAAITSNEKEIANE